MKDWIPPADLFAGRTVAILAGGPSLTPAAVETVRARGWAAIAINNAYTLAPWADALYAADGTWWTKYYEQARHFAGLKIHSQRWSKFEDVHFLPPKVMSGGNSAIHAAVLARGCGATRLVLLGVDLRDDELTHWHGLHPSTKTLSMCNPTPQVFRVYRAKWIELSKGLLKGFDVINCNPRSAVTVFPMLPLEAVPA